VIKIIIDGHLIGKTRVEMKMSFRIVTKSKNKAKFKKKFAKYCFAKCFDYGDIFAYFFVSLYKLFHEKQK
jgi:hypothetical protein